MPRNRGKNITLLASMDTKGMGPTLAVEGTTDGEVFEAYVEEVLAPSLWSEQIVVMDNLAAHKGDPVRELIEERGCELRYLPPYSPDLNPIEEAFSKIKGILRKAEATSREALTEAMGGALEALTARDAGGFFRRWGYRSLGQLLWPLAAWVSGAAAAPVGGGAHLRGRLGPSRRLSKDHERLPVDAGEAMIYGAMSRLMVRSRLARLA